MDLRGDARRSGVLAWRGSRRLDSVADVRYPYSEKRIVQEERAFAEQVWMVFGPNHEELVKQHIRFYFDKVTHNLPEVGQFIVGGNAFIRLDHVTTAEFVLSPPEGALDFD